MVLNIRNVRLQYFISRFLTKSKFYHKNLKLTAKIFLLTICNAYYLVTTKLTTRLAPIVIARILEPP